MWLPQPARIRQYNIALNKNRNTKFHFSQVEVKDWRLFWPLKSRHSSVLIMPQSVHPQSFCLHAAINRSALVPLILSHCQYIKMLFITPVKPRWNPFSLHRIVHHLKQVTLYRKVKQAGFQHTVHTHLSHAHQLQPAELQCHQIYEILKRKRHAVYQCSHLVIKFTCYYSQLLLL